MWFEEDGLRIDVDRSGTEGGLVDTLRGNHGCKRHNASSRREGVPAGGGSPASWVRSSR